MCVCELCGVGGVGVDTHVKRYAIHRASTECILHCNCRCSTCIYRPS